MVACSRVEIEYCEIIHEGCEVVWCKALVPYFLSCVIYIYIDRYLCMRAAVACHFREGEMAVLNVRA